MVRYVRDEELIADALKQTRRGVRDVQRPTGTERAQTMDTAIQAAADSTFAKNLAEQLEGELGPLPGQIQTALGEAAAALEESGLARSEAATAVADASAAVADATQAIEDAGLAQAAADGAATAASDAQTVAGAAQLAADAAATAAGNAQIAANGKNRVWYQGTAPAGTGHKAGDTWFDTSNGNRVTQWDGDSWEATQFGTGAIATAAITNALIADATIQSAKIANLDAAKITTGTLDAARIAALSITTGHLAANAVTAAKIAALTITAAEIAADAVTAVKIAADAVTAEKINAGAVTTDKLDALAVTAEKIAAGAIIADKIKANAITTAKLAVDAIDGMTITGALIRTAASGQRLEFDINGLISFNASNAITSSLKSDSGGLLLSGSLTSYPGGNSRRAMLSNGSLTFDWVGSPGAGAVTLGPDGLAQATSGTELVIANNGGGTNSNVRIRTGQGGVDPNSRIYLDGPVTFQGDTDWHSLIPSVGWNPVGGHTPRARISSGVLWMEGAFARASGGSMTSVATLPSQIRNQLQGTKTVFMGGHTANKATAQAHAEIFVQVDTGLILVGSYTNIDGTVGWVLPIGGSILADQR